MSQALFPPPRCVHTLNYSFHVVYPVSCVSEEPGLGRELPVPWPLGDLLTESLVNVTFPWRWVPTWEAVMSYDPFRPSAQRPHVDTHRSYDPGSAGKTLVSCGKGLFWISSQLFPVPSALSSGSQGFITSPCSVMGLCGTPSRFWHRERSLALCYTKW